jgi:hypothetical protein
MAQAQQLIAPQPLVRKFPQGQFCPLPVDLSFTADGPSATLHFEANIYADIGGTLFFTAQRIDNVCLVPDAAFVANTGATPERHNLCYFEAPVTQICFFDQIGSLPLLERFDVDPAGGDWDLTQGAFFIDGLSADGTPAAADPGDDSGGCLAMGQDNGGGSATDVARTSITVDGLIPDGVYHVVAWWDVSGGGIFEEKAILTISVTGSGGTPIARKSWGAVKSSYK